jgi:hypothetical protein
MTSSPEAISGNHTTDSTQDLIRNEAGEGLNQLHNTFTFI